MEKGKLVSFEGIDNSGKGTQIKLLEDYLKEKNVRVVSGRDPGNTSLGEILRVVLKQPRNAYEHFSGLEGFPSIDLEQRRTTHAEMLMYMAARAEFVEHSIKPAIDNGTSFLADRLGDSTSAYQGGGRYNSNKYVLRIISHLNNLVMGKYKPAKTFLFDISYEAMLERAKSDDEALDYLESSGRDFFLRVINVYRDIARSQPGRVKLIDGTKSIDEIFTVNILPEAKKIWKM